MNGTVHVLDPSAVLPYTQLAYDAQTVAQIANIAGNLIPPGLFVYGANSRVYTVGKIVSTGGGWQYGSMFRFVDALENVITKSALLRVHVGQTVEFANIDPAEPHRITFGCPTDDAACPVGGGPGAFVDTSGLLTATRTQKTRSTQVFSLRERRIVQPVSVHCREHREHRRPSRRSVQP